MKNKKLILLIVGCLLIAGTAASYNTLRAEEILIVGTGDNMITVTPNAITWLENGDVQFQLKCDGGELRLITGTGVTVQRWTQ